jgi:hypothetical protein
MVQTDASRLLSNAREYIGAYPSPISKDFPKAVGATTGIRCSFFQPLCVNLNIVKFSPAALSVLKFHFPKVLSNLVFGVSISFY